MRDRGLAGLLLTFLVVFLYQLGNILMKIPSWEIAWNPPTVGEMVLAIAAGLGAVGAALGLDVPNLIRSVRGSKE